MTANNSQKLIDILSNTEISKDEHAAYIKYHDEVSADNINELELREASKKLFRKRESIEDKRHVLFLLAHHETLWALYAIQRYLKNPDKELISWAILAWQECQSGVMSAAMTKFGGDDEAEALVMGRVDGDKTRFCFATSTLHGMFPAPRRDRIRKALTETNKKYGATVADTLFGRQYARIIVLIPHEVAVGDFIESVINSVNGSDPFLRFHYFVVNTRILTREEIKEYVRGLEKQ